MKSKVELRDLGGGDCTGPGEGRQSPDSLGTLGGKRSGQMRVWHNFTSSFFSFYLLPLPSLEESPKGKK